MSLSIYQLGYDTPVIDQSAFIFENAVLIGRVSLAPYASVWPHAILRGDNEWIEVGNGSNIQDAAVLHTDPGFKLQIGKHVTIGHQCMLHGCTIGDNTLIGIQSIILNGAQIGDQCLIGAGTLITEHQIIPSGCLVIGRPGKIVRQLNPEEIDKIILNAERYEERAQFYKLHLQAMV